MNHYHYLIVPDNIEGNYDEVFQFVYKNSMKIPHYLNGMGNEKRKNDAYKVAIGGTGNNFFKAAPIRLMLCSGIMFNVVHSEPVTEEEARHRELSIITPKFRQAINETIKIRLESLNRTEEEIIEKFPVFYLSLIHISEPTRPY